MAKTETLTVEVAEELIAAMRGAVHDGDYRSDDEVVSDALTRWNEDRSLSAEDIAMARKAWQGAFENKGPYLTIDEVFDPLIAEL